MSAPLAISGRSRFGLPTLSPVHVLILVWIAEIVLLICLQLIGTGEGMSVIPLGEDRTWTQLFANNTGFSAHRQWWQMASRNPLAPWWYWAFLPLIRGLPEGLYVFRKIVDLFLGISVFLLINQLGRGRAPRFALTCGLLVLLWNFTGYLEQVMVTMLIALGFSILSVLFFCRYLDSERNSAVDLALSLLLFFVALATYAIQSGVPLAIFLLAMLRTPDAAGAAPRVQARFRRAIIETGIYLGFFVLFMQIWVTTSGATSGFFRLDISLFWKNLWSSIGDFLWHEDTSELIHSVVKHWSAWAVVVTAAASAGAFWIIFMRAATQPSAIDAERQPHRSNAMWLSLAIVLALVVPTVILESTSMLWYPGSRSRMVQQVFQPIAYVATGFLFFEAVRPHLQSRTEPAKAVLAALLCAFATVIGLEYNRQLVEQTVLERNLARGLKTIVPKIVRPTHFVVRMRDTFWYSGRIPAMTNLYAQAVYGSTAATMDAVYARSPSDVASTVDFGDDAKGLNSPARGAWVPYDQVVLVDFDGTTTVPMNRVDAKAFEGFHAIFSRDRPLLLKFAVGPERPTCPTSLDFDATPAGAGWSVPERSAAGESFTWMAASEATVNLVTSCRAPLQLTFRTLSPMASDILQSLRVSIGGATVPLETQAEPNGATQFSASLPASAPNADGSMVLTFSVNRTVIPQGGERTLAVPFDWLRLEEKSKSP